MSILKNIALRLKGGKENTKFDVNREQAIELLGDDSVKVLDVRTPKEIEKTPPLVEDALLIDYYENDFRERLEELPREDTYLVV